MAWMMPRRATFISIAFLVSACGWDHDSIAKLPESSCNAGGTPIAQVQGSGESSPLIGQEHSVAGIVTFVDADSGVYIEQAASDSLPNTSDGLFLDNSALTTDVKPGDSLMVRGVVAESGQEENTITSLTQLSGYRVCASSQPLPVTTMRLPLSPQEREAREAMNLRLDQRLFVSDAYLAGSGLLTIGTSRHTPAPTEIARPGRDARAQSLKNRRSSLKIRIAENDRQLFASGAELYSVEGVLGHDGTGLRLLQRSPLRASLPSVYQTRAPAAEDIRLVSLNLLNYFNGNGRGSGFPTSRGAETPAEFSRQRERIVELIRHLQPHILAVQELENDGFEPNSAAADLLRDLEKGSSQAWLAVDPGTGKIGSDEITVGLFYRGDRVSLAGKSEVLATSEFSRLSRQPMAQTFMDRVSGQSFLIAVNHLKSKGSCPPGGANADRKDGQGCWSPARTAAAKAMVRWVRSLAAATAGGKALIVGDMNAYRMEDPIQAVLDAGFADLNAPSALGLEFSYIYKGQAGTLDYAFASSGLRPQVRAAMVPHFNSPYPREQKLPLPWLGVSDHDPVVVDLRLRQ